MDLVITNCEGVQVEPGLEKYMLDLYQNMRDPTNKKEWTPTDDEPERLYKPIPYRVVDNKARRIPVIVTKPEKRKRREDDEQVRKRPATSEIVDEQKRRNENVFLYIGNLSLKERQELFKAYFRDTNNATIRRKEIQNPYDNDTWYTMREIDKINRGTVKSLTEYINKQEIANRYHVAPKGTCMKSLTTPTLYLVKPKKESQFRDVLYGSNEMVMKVIPLFDKNGLLLQSDLDEIYNEIKVAFFLNELLFGYENVLSIHFMTIVDWFQSTRTQLDLRENTLADPLLHQVVIAERANIRLVEFLALHNDLETLRAILFQILHALETAWLTNEFTHNDLHMGNIMLRDVSHIGSPLRDMSLVYNRFDRRYWYVLPKAHLHNHIVKLIDFGRSRLYAPLTNDHISANHHNHPKRHMVIMPDLGIMRDVANRQLDLRILFVSILALPRSYWTKIGQKQATELFDFVERDVLDFDLINLIIDAYATPKEKSERFVEAGGKLRAHNLHKCPSCLAFLSRPEVFVYRYDNRGSNVTDVLNSAFFGSFSHALDEKGEQHFSKNKKQGEHIVVSFISASEDIVMRKTRMFLASDASSGQQDLRCSVCHHEKASFINREETGHIVPLCSEMCAQFKYFFGCKTVLR